LAVNANENSWVAACAPRPRRARRSSAALCPRVHPSQTATLAATTVLASGSAARSDQRAGRYPPTSTIVTGPAVMARVHAHYQHLLCERGQLPPARNERGQKCGSGPHDEPAPLDPSVEEHEGTDKERTADMCSASVTPVTTPRRAALDAVGRMT
jgi:hypothetical protein